MTIWVDADACPNAIKTILFRAAERTDTALVLVANQSLPLPKSRWIRQIRVLSGFDVADNEIVQRVQPGDLVITSDIPLAADVIEKQGEVVTPRGELYTLDNIRARLNMRDFMDTMRASGIQSGGPAALNEQDKRQFANALDGYLARRR
jgi:uncharacterized protein YaiI (UPF0178 family)